MFHHYLVEFLKFTTGFSLIVSLSLGVLYIATGSLI